MNRTMMRAAILSIGDELILGQTLDTNSQWISDQLVTRGVLPVEHRTIDDHRQTLTEAIRHLATRCELLILTGGLGPTDDDITRDALGDVFDPGWPLVTDDSALDVLRRWFEKHHRDMPAGNMRQAQHPASMTMIRNPVGTAPGLSGTLGQCFVFALPGPPREMKRMFDDHVIACLDEHVRESIHTKAVRMFGLGESDAAQRLGDLMDRDRALLVGTTASDGIITARLRSVAGSGSTHDQVEKLAEEVAARWAPYAFGCNDDTLPSVVGDLLRTHNATLSLAESCTGGWLGKMIVDVPGASGYLLGGWITYSNAMKVQQLNVPEALIEEHGAVSMPVAEAMAVGALLRAGSTYALSITGIASPDPLSSKPAGAVFIGLAYRTEAEQVCTQVRRFAFPRGRMMVRDRSAKAALQMLRFHLLEVPRDGTPLIWEVPLTDDAAVSERNQT